MIKRRQFYRKFTENLDWRVKSMICKVKERLWSLPLPQKRRHRTLPVIYAADISQRPFRPLLKVAQRPHNRSKSKTKSQTHKAIRILPPKRESRAEAFYNQNPLQAGGVSSPLGRSLWMLKCHFGKMFTEVCALVTSFNFFTL